MIVRSVAIIAALATLAHADAPHRKAVPPKYKAAAAKLFDQAVAAEQKGEPARALVLYEQALIVAPHPATAFNLVELRREQYVKNGANAPTWRDVELEYMTYVNLETDAALRKAAATALANYKRDPVELVLIAEGVVDLAAAFVMVDGAIVVRPGAKPVDTSKGPSLKLMVAPGARRVDVVTELTSVGITIAVDPIRPIEVVAKPERPRESGNVIISGANGPADVWLRGPALDVKPPPRRTTIKPGVHQLAVFGRTDAESFDECRAVEIDVPKAGLLYWYLPLGDDGCPGQPRQHKLAFP